MIKCKVTKKIMQEPGTVMGFSIGQVIMLIVGCVATIGTLLLLWLVLKINILPVSVAKFRMPPKKRPPARKA